MTEEITLVGEAIAGEAAQTLKQIKNLVKGLSTNTFDLGELLYKVKKQKFYAPKYATFREYTKDLEIKQSKCSYLVKISEFADVAGIPREQYEPVGIAKLRIITRLSLYDQDGLPNQYNGIPVVDIIKKLIADAPNLTPGTLEKMVKALQGFTGDNEIVWMNLSMTLAQRTKLMEAVDLATKNIGSTGKDEDGQYKDASMGRCLEVLALSYLLDPNNTGE